MAKKITTVTKHGTRLEQLKTLASMLAEHLLVCEPKEMAQLAKQYRETIYEIEEIEGREDTDDELSRILSDRESDGKAGTVRKDRSKFN